MAQETDLAEQAQAYISEAQLAVPKRKAFLLTQVQEILGHRDPTLVPRFLPYIATFQADPSAPVRRQVLDTLGFLVGRQPEHADALVDVLKYLRHDAELSVRRRVLAVLAKFVPNWLRYAVQRTNADQRIWQDIVDVSRQMVLGESDPFRQAFAPAVYRLCAVVAMCGETRDRFSIVLRRRKGASENAALLWGFDNFHAGMMKEGVVPSLEDLQSFAKSMGEALFHGYEASMILDFERQENLDQFRALTQLICDLAAGRNAYMEHTLAMLEKASEEVQRGGAVACLLEEVLALFALLTSFGRDSADHFKGSLLKMETILLKLMPELKGTIQSIKSVLTEDRNVEGDEPPSKRRRTEGDTTQLTRNVAEILRSAEEDLEVESSSTKAAVNAALKKFLSVTDTDLFANTERDEGSEKQKEVVEKPTEKGAEDPSVQSPAVKQRPEQELDTELTKDWQVTWKPSSGNEPRVDTRHDLEQTDCILENMMQQGLDDTEGLVRLSGLIGLRMLAEQAADTDGQFNLPPVVKTFCGFVVAEKKRAALRIPAALSALHRIYAESFIGCSDPTMSSTSPPVRNPAYEALLRCLLDALQQLPKETLFVETILRVPWLPRWALETSIMVYINEGRHVAGLLALKEILENKPAMRELALSVVLSCCAHLKPKVRSNARRLVRVLTEDVEGASNSDRIVIAWRRVCVHRFAIMAMSSVVRLKTLAEQVLKAGGGTAIDWQDAEVLTRTRESAQQIIAHVHESWDTYASEDVQGLLSPGIRERHVAGDEEDETAARINEYRASNLFLKSRMELCVYLAQEEPGVYLKATMESFRRIGVQFSTEPDIAVDPADECITGLASSLVATAAHICVFSARTSGVRTAVELLRSASSETGDLTKGVEQLHEIVLRCVIASEASLPSAAALNCIREWRGANGMDATACLLPLSLEAMEPAKIVSSPEWAELISKGDFDALRACFLVLMQPTQKGRVTLPAWVDLRLRFEVDSAMLAVDESFKEHKLDPRPRRNVLVGAVDLLILLHRTTSPAIPGNRLLKAIQNCLEWEAMTEAVIRDALDRLTQVAPVPLPFLRTTILAIKRFGTKTMKDFVAYVVLIRLVDPEHRVWANKNLWSGYLMVCDLLVDEEGVPRSPAPALLRLPTEALNKALLARPGWRQGLSHFALREWDQRDSELTVGLMEVLGITAEEVEAARSQSQDANIL